ncbi:MAG: L-seryl-tRNA(Sec) selenium transferase [Treponema sp.]
MKDLSSLPQVEKLLNAEKLIPSINELGRSTVATLISSYLNETREKIRKGEDLPSFEDCVNGIVNICSQFSKKRIKQVINATGVVLHTNLGRSPLPSNVWDRAKQKGSEYSSIEMDLYSGKRGGRFQFLTEAMAELLGAESSLLLNNNAAAVFLMLKALAEGKEVIVPRGQQVQIGGGFRVPEILAMAGCRLIEVGTTNITTLDDIKNAITENTALVLYVHTSNYKIRGFTQTPSIKEIKKIIPKDVILAVDQGSGNLFFNIPDEPTCKNLLKDGADLVCFSGDKLLGGPQAGWVVGKNELVKTISKHQLMRTYRVGKAVASLMEETLIYYLNGGKPFAIKALEENQEKIQKRAETIVAKLSKKEVTVKEATFSLGGGTSPDVTFPTYAIEISAKNIEKMKVFLRDLETPIITIIFENTLLLHLITVKESDDEYLASSLQLAFENNCC